MRRKIKRHEICIRDRFGPIDCRQRTVRCRSLGFRPRVKPTRLNNDNDRRRSNDLLMGWGMIIQIVIVDRLQT